MRNADKWRRHSHNQTAVQGKQLEKFKIVELKQIASLLSTDHLAQFLRIRSIFINVIPTIIYLVHMYSYAGACRLLLSVI